MKVLLTGSSGQLGKALRANRPSTIDGEPLELICSSRSGGKGLIALDLADSECCRAVVNDHRPQWVLNAGAYTAVDKAESEPELAQAVNGGGPGALAEALAATGGRILQLSTDFVFSGEQGYPYQPDQLPSPLGVYGASKASGEKAVAVELDLAPHGRATILRTSWLYGPVGSNFLLTMLRLHQAKVAAGKPLEVVVDQVGCPTSTLGLAKACWRLIQRASQVQGGGIKEQQLPSILHWSDAGAASWYDFAVAIGELGVAAGLLQQAAVVQPITTADYPTPARRPSYSLLDCSLSWAALGLHPQHWREALKAVIAVVASA